MFYKNKDVLKFPDEDEFCEMYLQATRYLQACGYEKYEISNFSKPGYESRHNMKYWKMDEYIGLGPGAHSFVNGRRYAYFKDLLGYIKSVNENSQQKLSEDKVISQNDLLGEEFMLAMRLACGYDMNDRFEIDADKLDKFEKYGYIERKGKNIRFTDNGFLVSNYLLSELINFD